MIVLELDTKHRVRECFYNGPLNGYGTLFCHYSLSMARVNS